MNFSSKIILSDLKSNVPLPIQKNKKTTFFFLGNTFLVTKKPNDFRGKYQTNSSFSIDHTELQIYLFNFKFSVLVQLLISRFQPRIIIIFVSFSLSTHGNII